MAEDKFQITGKAIEPRKYIELYGVAGRFDLPNKSVKVNYFSTVASGDKKKINDYALLKELKPMRERVRASEIKDLSSLLQRNLNDYRVAFELVPYLLKTPDIAFFGAILGVLIPTNFLNESKGKQYPKKTESEHSDRKHLSFEDKWTIDLIKIGGKQTNIAMLSIDLTEVEVVVLDGQHRANAFRVVSGAFDDRDSSVYPAFYKDIVTAENLEADLPITLVWFENDNESFDPKFVSRRLFVDVNNTAKTVSKSRRILLDDSEVPSLMTRFFYSALAQSRSFSVEAFSLFHSEFDKDTDIKVNSNNVLAITNPEFVHEIFSWLTLGARTFSPLHTYRSKDIFKGSVQEFSQIFNGPEFNAKDIDPFGELLNSRFVTIKDPAKIDAFEREYKAKLHGIVVSIFQDLDFFKLHYKACAEIEKWYKDGMNTTQTLIWDEVFTGGEGLYYTFKNKDILEKANNQTLTNYVKAIDEIETEFKKQRAKFFKDVPENLVNSAFSSASTKAFQVGMFMALDFFKEDLPLQDKVEEFLTRLNGIKPENWIVILNEIREELIVGVDPKQWPAYENLIIRLIQRDFEYYDKTNYLSSPDGVIFQKQIERQFDAWYEIAEVVDTDLSLKTLGQDNVSKWSKVAKEFSDKLITRAGAEVIPNVEELILGQSIIEEIIIKINPNQ